MMKIALDIDGVLANFTKTALEEASKLGLEGFPGHWTQVCGWHFEKENGRAPTKEAYRLLMNHMRTEHDAWLRIEPMPMTWPLGEWLQENVDCYITSRMCPERVTAWWLKEHDFPDVPIIKAQAEDKWEAAKERGVDFLVDDKTETVHIALENGVGAYLMAAPSNRNDRGSLLTINSLSELEIICGRRW